MNEPSPPMWTSASVTADPEPVEQPDWRFLLSHPAHGIALGLGSGLLRPAPGTWGTLAGWLIFAALDGWLTTVHWTILIVAAFLLGAACAQRTGSALGRADHGAIVIDEIVAVWIVLVMVPPTFGWQALGVAAFRVFDIAKPPPIRALDQRWKNGFGVMIDDVVAAFYALLVVSLAMRLVR